MEHLFSERGGTILSATNYRHIVFDVDGTLIDNEEAVLRSLQQTLEQKTERKFEPDDLRFALGIPGGDALARLGLADVPGIIEAWERNFSSLGPQTRVFGNIETMLSALKASGYALGVITSKTKSEYAQDVTKLFPSLSAFFEVVVCADDTERHKPHPDPMRFYMSRTGARVGEILYIGDSTYDYECADSAGVDFGLAVWGAKTSEGRQATHFFAQPREILNLLTGA